MVKNTVPHMAIPSLPGIMSKVNEDKGSAFNHEMSSTRYLG